MLSLVKHSKIWVLIPAILVGTSLILFLIFGLKPGIDFTGGSLVQVQFTEQSAPTLSNIRNVLHDTEWADVSVQVSGENQVLVRTKEINNEQKTSLLKIFSDEFGALEELRFDTIGPTIGNELRQQAIGAVIVVMIAIVVYLAYAFRKVSGPVSSWKFGVCAVIALIHDVLILIGVFVLLGLFNGVEIDTLFVVALLTVIGYSVHDTIVVFDRIRAILLKENVSFEEAADRGVHNTITRSINTTMTTLFVLISLLLFGGESIFYFILALSVGVAVGTYSSIFLATPLLVLWQRAGKK